MSAGLPVTVIKPDETVCFKFEVSLHNTHEFNIYVNIAELRVFIEKYVKGAFIGDEGISVK